MFAIHIDVFDNKIMYTIDICIYWLLSSCTISLFYLHRIYVYHLS